MRSPPGPSLTLRETRFLAVWDGRTFLHRPLPPLPRRHGAGRERTLRELPRGPRVCRRKGGRVPTTDAPALLDGRGHDPAGPCRDSGRRPLRSGDCHEGPSAGKGAGADRGCCSRPSCENERNRPPEPIQGGPPLGSDDALPSSARGNTGNRTRSTKLVPAAVLLGNRWRSMRNSRPRERRFPSENWPVLAERSTRGSQGTRHAASGSQILHRNPSRKAGAQALSPAPPPPPTHPCRDPQASPNHRRRETAPPTREKAPKRSGPPSLGIRTAKT